MFLKLSVCKREQAKSVSKNSLCFAVNKGNDASIQKYNFFFLIRNIYSLYRLASAKSANSIRNVYPYHPLLSILFMKMRRKLSRRKVYFKHGSREFQFCNAHAWIAEFVLNIECFLKVTSMHKNDIQLYFHYYFFSKERYA